ncbi:MAG: DinB family protein [Polaromonas sp.]|uniref:DinB family protein n=1 Tax=Polaromonas sp. TaxID=1869339 RepID=UPI0040351DDB
MDAAFLDNYRFLARYNRWMNQRLYAACEPLGDAERQRQRGAFFGSIHHTLTHLLLADRLWLQRFASQPTRFAALDAAVLALPPGVDYVSVDACPDWNELRQARDAPDQRIESWLAEMTPDFLTSTMVYANTKGVQRAHPAWQAMTHFFNHQTHHRGQTTTLLMQAGVDVGVTDLVALL